jgi:hypothetical protein
MFIASVLISFFRAVPKDLLKSKRCMASLLLLVISCCAIAQSSRESSTQDSADEVPEANPARPTVATPATLTSIGYLQFENVLAGFQAVVLPGQDKRPTVALSYFKHVYAGSAPDVDFGTPEHSLLLLISGDLVGFHFDLNGMFNEQTDNHISRAQFGQTISISHPWKAFTIAGELWHFTQPFLRGNAVGNLWAVSYPVRRNLVVDAGFNRGLTSSSTQWEGFAGFTYLLPRRLWKTRPPAEGRK